MIGVLSDAHGNRPAFDLSIDVLRRYGANSFIFLGDAVGYIPPPNVISAIQDLGEEIICIRGNHEDILIKGLFDPSCEPIYQHAKTKREMNTASIDFIEQWPSQLIIEFEAGKVMFVHGSPQDPTYGYVYPDTDISAIEVKETFVFMGHTHRPFMRNESGTTYVNVGSCGLPRDRGALGSAGLFDEHTGVVQILRFDIRKQIEQALASVNAVHPSVLAMYQRQPQSQNKELNED